ncbi:MAG: hypothetical protein QGI13_01365 [Rhodospirillales bacterium]|jgi:hypothetical protein|nr:hypothetical protein [Rhodospirillales bacterium]
MTGFSFDFDAPARPVQNAPERPVAESDSATVDTKHGGGVLPHDVVEPPVGLGKDDPAEVKARGEQLQQKLAHSGTPGGDDLAVIDELMEVFLFQAQMAVAKGDAKTAEMIAKMAGGMVDKARNALVGAKDDIASAGAGNSTAVRQGMADLVKTVQRIAVQARNVASVAASALHQADHPGDVAGADKTKEIVEEAIKQMITALHDEPDPSRVGGSGKSGTVTKTPSVIVSTEA